MAEANPAALREIAQRFAEAVERGLWQPRRNSAAALLDELAPTPIREETDAWPRTRRREAEHRAKMARIKAAKDRLYASKTGEKGLLIVHTGTGKGKSTAAWGLAMRCLGHGLKLGVVQFVKGRSVPGERQFLERFPELVTIKVMGHGFTWETPGPRPGHRRRPRRVRARRS